MEFRKEHMIVAVFLTILSSVMAMLADPVCYGTDDIFAAIFLLLPLVLYFLSLKALRNTGKEIFPCFVGMVYVLGGIFSYLIIAKSRINHDITSLSQVGMFLGVIVGVIMAVCLWRRIR